MSFKRKIEKLKKIQKSTSNWSDDKTVGEAIKALEQIQEIKQIIADHDNDRMPKDYWYIDRIREVLREEPQNLAFADQDTLQSAT